MEYLMFQEAILTNMEIKEDLTDYHVQAKHNEEKFREMIKLFRPDIHLLMETIDQTNINPFVVWKIIYALSGVANDTKYGQVNILIEDNVVRFVRGEHADKVNQSIFKEKKVDENQEEKV